MTASNSLPRFGALSGAIVLALLSTTAQGAAFQLRENSAKGLGRAFAGSQSAPGDASVVATNPAAMSLLDGTQLQGDLSAVSFSAEFDGAGRYAGPTGPGTGFPIAGSDGGDAGKIAAVPAMYFHAPIGDRAHFGLSLNAPFGFSTDYDRDWIGRYDGLKTELKTVDLGASFGYAFNDKFSLGASVFAERLDIELSNAIDFGAILAGASVPGFAPGSDDGRVRIEGDNVDWGYTVGALFSPGDNTHIGLSYRSKVEHEIDDGDADFTVPADVAGILAVAQPGVFVDTKGRATVELPAFATLSLTQKLNDDWTVMADLSRTFWSRSFDTVTIAFDSAQPDSVLDFSYRNTTFASLGTEYRASDTLTLRGGVAFDETPTTTAHRDVRVPDTNRRWLSLGLTWKPASNSAAEYSVGYTHLFTGDPRVSVVSATGSTLAGDYDVGGDILAVQARYTF